MQISDRCFLITGGGSGLGAASARMLVDAGARVVLADVNAAAGQQTAAALGEAARFVHCDVTREEDGKAAVSAARQHGGALHGLLNCAGIGIPSKVLGKNGPHDLATFSKVIQINLIGSFNMIRLASGAMAAAAYGSVVAPPVYRSLRVVRPGGAAEHAQGECCFEILKGR